MSIIDRIESLFRTRRYPFVESLKTVGVDHATAEGIKQLLIDRRSSDETRKRVVQFAAKGRPAYYDLLAILKDAPALIPANSRQSSPVCDSACIFSACPAAGIRPAASSRKSICPD